jgi:DOPA 4,5-dioxygenase
MKIVPELRIYPLHTIPQGPHAPGMFEVALFSPHQFGAFVSWLFVHRGPLSALVHPNTDDELRDHLHMTAWLGPEVPLDMGRFRLRPVCETMDKRGGTVTRIVDTGLEGKTVKEVRRIE